MKRIIILAAVVAVVVYGVNNGWFEKLGNSSSSSAAPSCKWSLPALAAQVVVMPVDTNLTAAQSAVEAGAGGVILFGTMPTDLGAQLTSLVSHAPKGYPPLVMTDEEGGRVERLRGVVDALPSARTMANTMSPSQIKEKATKIGTQMKQLGVTMDLAPVLDLDDRPFSNTNPDGDRSFSINPGVTSQDGVAFMQGLQAGGVVPTVKHFPGLGYASGNTDFQAAHTLPWSQLQKAGLLPFKAAIDADAPVVMTSNAGVPGLTDLPASLSPEVTKVLRDDLGFKGIIMTDSLSAVAIQANGYTPAQAGVAALKAGADMVLYGGPGTPVAEYKQMTDAIEAAVTNGTLTHDRLVEAANRVMTVKHLATCG